MSLVFANIFNFIFLIFSFFLYHHLYMMNHSTIFSLIFFFSITKDYTSPCLTLCAAVGLCHILSLFLVRVWVEVMFESDNVRKLKTEGGNMALQFISALHPLCIFCDYFWNISLTTPTRQTTLTEIISNCRHYSKTMFHVDNGHLAAARGLWADGVAGPRLDVRRAGSRRE